MALSFPTQTNGGIADADLINDMADAIVGHDTILTEVALDLYSTGKWVTTAATKATSASASDVAITDYTLSAEIPAGRIVEFVARIRVQSTVAADVALIRLRQTGITGTIAAEERLPLPVAAAPLERTLHLPWRSTGGTITWQLCVQRLSGTGSVTVTTGGPTLPGMFYVRDIGSDSRFTII